MLLHVWPRSMLKRQKCSWLSWRYLSIRDQSQPHIHHCSFFSFFSFPIQEPGVGPSLADPAERLLPALEMTLD